MNSKKQIWFIVTLILSLLLPLSPSYASAPKKEEAPKATEGGGAPATPDPKAQKQKEKEEKGHGKKEEGGGHGGGGGHGKDEKVYEPPKDTLDKAIPPYETPLGTVFTYQDKFAKQVTIVGDFNNWNPKITRLKANSFKVWSVTVPLKRGKYSYKFNVDGQWVLDPMNPKKVSNDLGDERSLFVVEQGSDYYLKQFGHGLREASAPKAEPLGIVFTYRNMDARSVSVAGSFNGWNKDQHHMTMNDNGIWSVRIPMPKGNYQYKFFVDNLWIADPMNQANGYDEMGQMVSSLRVATDFVDTKTKPHDIERIPYKFKYFNPRLPSRMTISVIGSFNDWDPTMHIMTDKDQDKIWETIAYLRPGNYHYRFKVGNEVFLDPYNPKQKKWEDGQPASWIELFQPPQSHFVKFIYRDIRKRDIRSVAIAGDFNNFNPENDQLEWDPENRYWYTILDLPKGQYKYRYLINNRLWEIDRGNPDNVADDKGTLWSMASVGITNKPKVYKAVKKSGHH